MKMKIGLTLNIEYDIKLMKKEGHFQVNYERFIFAWYFTIEELIFDTFILNFTKFR